jgi:membrane associated rhomboid family serine protease
MLLSGDPDGIMNEWGFRPDQWDRHGYMTLFTGFFLHAGLFHLLSNMYFLMVFGDSVEHNLGPLWYLFLLATAHLAGTMLHGAYDPHRDIACVGASAGISGVIAYYAMAFPKARIGILPSIFFVFFGLLRIPAFLALVLFAIVQIIGAYAQVQGHSNISYLAHLGGLGVGVVIGIAARIMMPGIQMGRVAPPVATAR